MLEGKMETNYTKLTIESCEGGWIVKEKGQPTRLFVRWESVIYFLEDRLTNKQRLS
jgi:hypothetical protein